MRQQVGQAFRRGLQAGGQQPAEGGIGQQHLALGIGDHRGLVGGADLAAHLLQLVERDQHPHGAELQHHVGDGVADQPGGGDVGRRPALGRAFHHLVPLGEGPPGRELGRVVADDHRLEGVAAPDDRLHLFRPEPDQPFARLLGHRGGQQPGGAGGQGGEARLLGAERGAGDGADAAGAARLGVQPGAEVAQLGGAGHLAGAEHLALEQQRPRHWRSAAAAGSAAGRTARRASRPRGRSPRSSAAPAGGRRARPGPGRSFRARRCGCRPPRPAARRRRGSGRGRTSAHSGGRRPGPRAGRRPSARRPASRRRPCSAGTAHASARCCAANTATCRGRCR